MSVIRVSKSLDRAHPAYRRKLDTRTVTNTGVCDGDAATGVFSAQCGQTQLSVQVDAAGIVRHAKHEGAEGDARSSFDVLCSIMIGRPLQEASDHGTIRLEAALRDEIGQPPMPGIIHAEAIEPLFAQAGKLVRALYAEYRETRGGRSVANMFVDVQQPSWLSRPPDLQLQAVDDAVRAALMQADFRPDDARVLGIEQGDRVMIAFRQSLDAMQKGCLALDLEIAVQAACEPTLQIFLVDFKDQNSARRL